VARARSCTSRGSRRGSRPTTPDPGLTAAPRSHARAWRASTRTCGTKKIGQTSYLGGLRGRAEQQRYADFYAHLHRVVDKKLGRLIRRLGDPDDQTSLRARTVIVRTPTTVSETAVEVGRLHVLLERACDAAAVPFLDQSPLPSTSTRARPSAVMSPAVMGSLRLDA
jgi:hypothetical protein